MEEKIQSQQTKNRVEILTINLGRWDRAQQIEKAAAKTYFPSFFEKMWKFFSCVVIMNSFRSIQSIIEKKNIHDSNLKILVTCYHKNWT